MGHIRLAWSDIIIESIQINNYGNKTINKLTINKGCIYIG